MKISELLSFLCFAARVVFLTAASKMCTDLGRVQHMASGYGSHGYK